MFGYDSRREKRESTLRIIALVLLFALIIGMLIYYDAAIDACVRDTGLSRLLCMALIK